MALKTSVSKKGTPIVKKNCFSDRETERKILIPDKARRLLNFFSTKSLKSALEQKRANLVEPALTNLN